MAMSLTWWPPLPWQTAWQFPPIHLQSIIPSVPLPWQEPYTSVAGPEELSTCIDQMSLPCKTEDASYKRVRHTKKIGSGSFGAIYLAHEQCDDGHCDRSKTYAVKFARNYDHQFYRNTLNEAAVTDELNEFFDAQFIMHNNLNIPYLFSSREVQHNLKTSPTIALHDSDSGEPDEQHQEYVRSLERYHKVVLVMDYHPLGDLGHLLKNDGNELIVDHWRHNPEGYVWKLLWDISLVMQVMHDEYHWYDADLKSSNILVHEHGWNNYKTTTFIKADYGLVMDEQAIQKQFDSEQGQKHGFCHMGTIFKFSFLLQLIISPMDLRVLRGDVVIANRYLESLQSKSIFSLAATGVFMYNALVADEHQIKLRPFPKNNSMAARKKFTEQNREILATWYSGRVYTNPMIPPRSVRDLLIKIYWMAYQQLDLSASVQSLMQWRQIRHWLAHDIWHLTELHKIYEENGEDVQESLVANALHNIREKQMRFAPACQTSLV